ncbi:NUDIX hydrolase [Streptomyces albidoflavus]
MTEERARTPHPRAQLVIGIVRRGDEILLARERLGADGELVHEALRRELREETGLKVGDPVRTAFLVHVDSPSHPSAWAAAFEVDGWTGELAPGDEDIERAAFFGLPDALGLLGRLDSAAQREPIVGYLSGEVAPGTMWLYRNDGTDETLVARW